MEIQLKVGEQSAAASSTPTARGGRNAESIVQDLHGRYSETSRLGHLFVAHATLTAPVIFSTAAGTGGPLIWNGSTAYNVNILKIGYSVSVVSTVAGSLGLTGGTGQTSAPSSTTAIDGSRCTLLGGAASNATSYRIGTVTNAGNFFIPFAYMHTGALTTSSNGIAWLDTEGILTVPPGSWVSVAGSATLTQLQVLVAVVWEEILV